jgi:hypothetical protein
VGVLGGAPKLSDVGAREGKKMKEFGYIDTAEPKPLIRLACQAQATAPFRSSFRRGTDSSESICARCAVTLRLRYRNKPLLRPLQRMRRLTNHELIFHLSKMTNDKCQMTNGK